MNCRECLDFLVDYLDGTLELQQRNVFEEHLHRCPPCVEYVRSYRLSIEIGRSVCQGEEAATPAPMPEALVQAILAARREAAKGSAPGPAAP